MPAKVSDFALFVIGDLDLEAARFTMINSQALVWTFFLVLGEMDNL